MSSRPVDPGLELWAGVECSVVRVGDTWIDEVVETGHERRLDDLDRLAELGVRAVRYPVLWERTAPDRLEDARWAFADQRLGRLRELGIRPIVGLVHHGSGPRGTSLLEGSFVTGLAAFARAVAERYPWVTDYTPVNEPLTTARFSALYGHWYPHARDTEAFLRALVVQCAATRAAMREIRKVCPRARLIQTEDAATVFSTPRLAYQADFENARRFASLDLLTGRFDGDHPLRSFFLGYGVPASDLDSFTDDPCPPDVVGLNYYVTSDRYLDERVELYPPATHGGNGVEAYADVEAVRVRREGIVGHRGILEQFWERYRIPVAVTEVHLGCTPEEQVRWLAEAWAASLEARSAGVDVRAVTAWSAFGACDWDSLLVERRGHYEPGLFDVRGGAPRPTAPAHVARDLALAGASDHPVLARDGWWRCDTRLLYPAPVTVHPVTTRAPPSRSRSPRAPRPIVVTGAGGTLGRAILRVCEVRGLPAIGLRRMHLDVADAAAVTAVLSRLSPWAVINAAGYVRVDDGEHERDRCLRENVDAVEALAGTCEAKGIRLVTFSSDLVFDGRQTTHYLESSPVAPLSVYGESKVKAEAIITQMRRRGLVVRTSAFFGARGARDFVVTTLERLRRGLTVHAATDQVVSPTYVPDLAHTVVSLLVDDAEGIWHVANPSAVSWVELAARAAALAGVSTDRLLPCTTAQLELRAARPAYSALGSERGALLPSLDDALARFFEGVSSGRDA